MVVEPLIFRIVLAVGLVGFVAHRAAYHRRLPPRESETLERLPPSRAARAAAALFALALLATVLYVVAPGRVSWAAADFPLWLRGAGAVAMVLGFLLLEWSHQALGLNWSDEPRITASQQLVQSGPYKWIRHPIYAAFLLILGSTLLISANWLVGLSWIAATAVDGTVRMRYEEQALRRRFGAEYDAYARRTGALLPRI